MLIASQALDNHGVLELVLKRRLLFAMNELSQFEANGPLPVHLIDEIIDERCDVPDRVVVIGGDSSCRCSSTCATIAGSGAAE